MFARKLLGLAVLAGATGSASAQQMTSYFYPNFTPPGVAPITRPPARIPAAPIRQAGGVQPGLLPVKTDAGRSAVPDARPTVLPDMDDLVPVPKSVFAPVPQELAPPEPAPVGPRAKAAPDLFPVNPAPAPGKNPPVDTGGSPKASPTVGSPKNVAPCPPPCVPVACPPKPERAWANFQWLYWATSGQNLPPLGTASPPGTARPLAGVLGTPNTAILYGNQRVNDDFRNGYRFTGGLWLNDARTWGVEGDFFFLQDSHERFAAASNGSQIIARPFFNTGLGAPDAALVAFPGLAGGSLTVDSRSSFIGGGVSLVRNLYRSQNGRLDFLAGYRYLNLTDEVDIATDSTTLPGPGALPPGTGIQVSDQFRAENNFHGGLIGLSGECQARRLFFGAKVSVAFGGNTETVDVNGTTNAGPFVFPGGLLAHPANLGRYDRTTFAVVPEVGLRAGVRVTDHARVYAGYNLIYLSDAVRAADQIIPVLNPSPLAPPSFTPRTTDFWVQGVNLGVELRY